MHYDMRKAQRRRRENRGVGVNKTITKAESREEGEKLLQRVLGFVMSSDSVIPNA